MIDARTQHEIKELSKKLESKGYSFLIGVIDPDEHLISSSSSNRDLARLFITMVNDRPTTKELFSDTIIEHAETVKKIKESEKTEETSK